MKTLRFCMLCAIALLFSTGYASGQLLESQRLKIKARSQRRQANNQIMSAPATSEQEFGAVPALTAALGSREIAPTITIHGSKNFGGDSLNWYGAVRVFTGALPQVDKEYDRAASALFIKEMSSFGFTSDFGRRIGPYVGINIGLSYFGKTLKPDSSHTVSTSVFHGRLGLEITPIPGSISLYINFNSIAVADRLAEFKEHYSNDQMFKPFIEYGASFCLDVDQVSQLQLVVDLNFIAQNGPIKSITKNDDLVVPVLKIGVKKAM